MATLNFSCLFKKTLKILGGSFLLVGFLGCQTLEDFGIQTRNQVNQNKKPPQEKPKSNVVGKASKTDVNKRVFNIEDENVRPKLGLILGPGLALSLSHLGVLKALNNQKIPIEVIAGLGWSSLISANYAINGAVNDMTWKASQGRFKVDVKQGFLGGEVKEASDASMQSLIRQYARGHSIQNSKIKFVCPSLNVNSVRTVYFKRGSYEKALINCMKTPPLEQTESRYWASLTEVDGLAAKMKSMGAKKIIFVNALPQGALNWGKYKSAVPNRDKYFWAQVQENLSNEFDNVDHVLHLKLGRYDVLDFKQVRSMINKGKSQGDGFFKRLARKYNF